MDWSKYTNENLQHDPVALYDQNNARIPERASTYMRSIASETSRFEAQEARRLMENMPGNPYGPTGSVVPVGLSGTTPGNDGREQPVTIVELKGKDLLPPCLMIPRELSPRELLNPLEF